MKKNLILTLGLALAVVFTGCKKDDDDPAALSVSNAPSTAIAASGGTASFNVQSNTDWTVSSDAVWATVSPASGKNNGTITVTATANTGEARSARITVSASGVTPCTVSISQSAAAGAVEPQVIDLGDGTNGFEIDADLTLSYPNTYILKGFVYVTTGATLTIEPGVVIKGEKATKGTLIVERGGKIVAQGTAERPIVFTSQQAPGSRAPGDWGGLIILGNAKSNQGVQTIEGGVRSQHGGLNDADDSGVLSYVRIEFAGIEYGPDNEINGLTMGSVGSKTKIDHIQVSHSGDDSFEWFGGAVSAKYLVAYHTWDDDFDADNGFSGNVQFGLIVRDPETADKSSSNGFESDNNSSGSTAEPYTSAVFSNVTSFGPVSDPANYVDRGNVNGSVPAGVFQAGVQLRRNTRLSLFNSAIAGWPIGLIIENHGRGTAQTWATDNLIRVNNVVLAGMQKNYQDEAADAIPVLRDNDQYAGTFVKNYFEVRPGNSTLPTIAALKVAAAPIAIPAADSPLAGAAAWTDEYVSRTDAERVNYDFEQVDYIGAFGPTETATNNWTAGWTNFDPQNTVY